MDSVELDYAGRTLIDYVMAASNINKGITFINGEKDEKYVSYKELYDRALGVLYELQEKGIEREAQLVFQIEDNEYFLYVFWACILGGITPIPVSVGNNDEHRLKLFRIWKVLGKPYLAASRKGLEQLEKYSRKSSLVETFVEVSENTVFLDELEKSRGKGNVIKIRTSDTAFIQFSSGSTGEPKGVILTHENVTVNVAAAIKASKTGTDDITLNWMPLTHDMGMIGMHLLPLFLGIDQYIMPVSLFIRQPNLWIRKVHEHKATIISSPNFGYKYLLTNLNREIIKDCDLSNIRIVYNGAEPISVELCQEFLNELGAYGLKKNSMLTVYGLAEACIAVCFPPMGEGIVYYNLNRESISAGQTVREVDDCETSDAAVKLVDLGLPVRDCRLRICDEEGNALDDNIVGHIHIKGKNVTSGYYNNTEATEKVLSKDGWLDTGDLGFMRNGRLVATGRAKDIIFVNGQNYYPYDIERVAEGVEEIELGKIAVMWGFQPRELRKEEIVLFAIPKGNLEEFVKLVQDLKKYINKVIGLEIKDVVPVKKMPKTTSGKIQRYKLGEMYSVRRIYGCTRRIEQAFARRRDKD